MIAAALGGVAMAQSGTNSPYSQYGLGVLADQSQGFNRAMCGVGQGLRYSNQVNYLNPASYSSVDSLTMLVDVGMSGQVTNFKEGGKRINANNADFEYVTAAFRMFPGIGMSVGVLPFTNVGYNYSYSEPIAGTRTSTTNTFHGSGGLRQAYLGVGWQVLPQLSVGMNMSYLWGTYDKYISISNSDNYVNTVTRNYSTTVNSYRIDFGAQWQQLLQAGDVLTLGATYTPRHQLGADANMTLTSLDKTSGESKSSTLTVGDAFALPTMVGVGIAWQHGSKLTLGLDYSLQQWGKIDMPEMAGNENAYIKKSGLLCDRHRIVVGGQWIPNPVSRRYYNRINYRFGVSYATPYVKVNGIDGPKEYTVSAGFGFPIVNGWNNRSMLNISGQWVRSSAKELITENTFRINIGLTFNERWFMKWKVK